ncbi:MAG: xylulokinase [Candidatus Aminicenantes bacterium]|nr:xylulokinase [Candidatus Aminicenantes bacterium]
MLAIGVDSGTQSTKVLVVEAGSGRVLGRGQAPHAMIPGLKPGQSEQDPATWVEALRTALAAALREAAVDPGRVVALGVSGQQHGFVPLGADGIPLRPAKLWNDTSTVAENEELVAALGGTRSAIDKLGLSPAVGFTASKILWLKRHEPENFARLRTVLLPHNYLNFVMTGEARMEYGDASGTGLMDIRRRVWNADALAAVDIDLAGKLPAIDHPIVPAGRMRPAFAADFGFKSVLIASGGGDNMMGAIGTGNVAPGVCTVSLGTSGTIYSFFDHPFSDPQGEIAGFCDSTGGWLPLLCTMNVTNTTELWKSLLGIDSDARDALAARASAGSNGLLFLPFIDGERVPPLPEASGVFFGLTRANLRAEAMTRSVMEGTLLNLGYGFGRMRELGLRPSQIRATGGGAKSPFWRGLAADILGAPVVTLAEEEAAAFGAALQAVWCWRNERGEKTAIVDLAAAWVKTGTSTAEPDPARMRLYADSQERFNRLWRTLTPEFSHRRQQA